LALDSLACPWKLLPSLAPAERLDSLQVVERGFIAAFCEPKMSPLHGVPFAES
jgi:hypothetical protein